MLKASQPPLQQRDRPGAFNHAAHGSWLAHSPRSSPAAQHRRVIGAATERPSKRREQPPTGPAPPSSAVPSAAGAKDVEFVTHKDRAGSVYFRTEQPTATVNDMPRRLVSNRAASDREVLIADLRERIKELMQCVTTRDNRLRQRDAEIASLRTELAQGISIAAQREVHTKTKRDTEEELKGMVERERAAMNADHAALEKKHSLKVAQLQQVVTVLKTQLDAAAVARAKDATDMQRLEERRINLLEDVTVRVVAQKVAEEDASSTGPTARELAKKLKLQQIQIQKLVHERQLMTLELERSSATLPAELRDERLLTLEQQGALDSMRNRVATLSHERDLLSKRLDQTMVRVCVLARLLFAAVQ
jgi:hypothetical protein